MTMESWNVDLAVTHGPWEEDLEGRDAVDRFGVTGHEEIAGEPLDTALAQEEADTVGFTGIDDQWVFVDDTDDFDRELAALDGAGPEAAAMHVMTF
jgi:hypothetical protein